MKKLVALAFISLLLSACTTDHGNFTVLSNKIVNTQDFSLDQNPNQKNVKGESIQHSILFFSINGEPTINDALNDVLRKSDSDVMTDAQIKYVDWTILLYGQRGWTIQGNAVKTRNN